MGIVTGKWLVSLDWLAQSGDAGYWIHESPFEIVGDTVTMQGSPQQARESLAKGVCICLDIQCI